MNKLGNALYEIHHMDMLAAKDQWVNKIHPLVKLILTIKNVNIKCDTFLTFFQLIFRISSSNSSPAE